ncbi:MAG TPA: alpha/beta fold hydrolase [Isosphaeraceae bacterium]|jgi:pimeloyl-ACP methyl ester carboxylesterase
MTTRRSALLATVGLAGAPAAARAQDFGRLLEKAGRDVLRNQLSRENIERTIKPLENGQAYPVRTADGWTLVAHRFRPSGPPRPGAMPVILCHGLSYNALFWNLDPACSPAQYLAQRGFDVWAVDLRGCGLSQKWVWRLDSAPTMVVGGVVRRVTGGRVAPTGYATVEPRYANWTLDDHVAYDVPALVGLVRQQTGAAQVGWVGHSMGGIVALCHLARYQNPGIGRLVTIGSQVTMPEGQIAVQFLQEMLVARQGQLTGRLNGRELAEQTHQSVNNLFFNGRHVSRPVYEALTTYANDVPSIGLLQQYMGLATRGELYDAAKQFPYARALGNVRVPLLIGCGASDQLAPPPVQQYLHAHVGSPEKALMIIGRAEGFAADAGHNDALVGLTSQQQVYPLIERWLGGRA